MIDKIWTWLLYSSSNREKISMSIKGAVGTLIVAASIFLGDINVPLLGENINAVIDAIFATIQAAVGLVSAIMMIVGSIRKVITTYKGTNDVVLGFRQNA